MTRRPRVAAGIAALTALALLSAPLQGRTVGDWQMRAWDGLGCGAEQVVLGRATGATLAEVVLFPRPDGAVMLVRVPTGVRLSDGIAYRHGPGDTTGVGLAWQDCSPRRCAALAQIDGAELRRLLAGREIHLGYRPTRTAPPLNVPVSLMGLTRTWEQVRACPPAP